MKNLIAYLILGVLTTYTQAGTKLVLEEPSSKALEKPWWGGPKVDPKWDVPTLLDKWEKYDGWNGSKKDTHDRAKVYKG